MVNRKSEKMLPHFKGPSELANRFGNENSPPEQLHSVPRLSDFEPSISKELSIFVSTSACKSFVLDPIPRVVMSDCLHVLLPAITRIVNLSLITGTVPPKMKEASLSPFLK